MGADHRPLVLLTGASGYIGGRLLKELEKAGWPVRCLARRPDFLRPRVAASTEVVKADCLDRSSLAPAMAGVHTAYYLVHSMGSPGKFEQEDREAAQNFADVARDSGVRRIVYLGGLGNQDQALSAHLRSRHEVADILRSSEIPTIEFRASIVIGSGSLSFEMIRALVQRLPVMICPRWVAVKAQPIAVEDVVAYLMAALVLPVEQCRVFEIGGTDQVSYGQIMQEYARQCGLRRWMIPVPILTPRLSSLWLGLITPVYARIGRKLIDSMRNPTLVHDTSALTAFDIKPKGLREAIERALHHEDQEFAQTSWCDALSSAGKPQSWGGSKVWHQARRFSDRASIGSASGSFCSDSAHRRFEWLVLCQCSLVVSRRSGSPCRGRGTAPGPSRSSHTFRRRCSGFLASGNLCAGSRTRSGR
jgi:uncharacterized protein YbjT (DUF2867 family)